ncbi:SLBP-like protein [Cryptosporidium canis]|nr:SLBP-like protein [Cryptosporidium canis]
MQDDLIEHRLDGDLFPILSPEILNEVMEEFPQIRLGPSVSQVLTMLTNGFLQDTIRNSYAISKHKNHSEIQADDILVYLKIKYPNTRLEEFCEIISQNKEGKNGLGTPIKEHADSENNGLLSIRQFNTERYKVNSIEERRISQRLKQINIAKNSIGYQRYTTAVRKNERKRELNLSWHPSTPDPYSNTSKSCFSGRLKEWKLRLHLWGNLDDAEFNYLVENNLKHPREAVPNFNNTRAGETIYQNIHTNVSRINLENLPDLKISPIHGLEESSLAKNTILDNRMLCAHNSQINSIILSKKILIPTIIDCGKSRISRYITLFIPDNYRGIQVWKSSNFIRHCDISSAANECYTEVLKQGLSLQEFAKRYDINVSKIGEHAHCYFKGEAAIFDLEKKDSEFKVVGKLYRDRRELAHTSNVVHHHSDKMVFGQNQLFEFREEDTFRLSVTYHPSTVVYSKILGKLNKFV